MYRCREGACADRNEAHDHGPHSRFHRMPSFRLAFYIVNVLRRALYLGAMAKLSLSIQVKCSNHWSSPVSEGFTGISHAYGGALSALSIHYTFTPIANEEGEPHWIEREVVSALYVDRQETIVDQERQVVGDFRFDTM